MRKLTVIFACIVGIALLAWLTGLISLGYHCLVLCLAFLAEYLTPQHTPVPPIDRAWHAWWQIGVAARWAYYQHDRALQQSTQDDAVLIGVGFVLVLFLFIPWKSVRLKASSVHGTAHWATWSEARAFFAPLLGRARHESSLPLGRYKGRSLALKEKQLEEHVLIVGPTGKGKTAGIIAPGILSERGSRSLVIIDPKQELVRLTAGAVSEHMRVWLFAPTQPERSQHYNPLAYINSMEDAEEFAACWVSNTGRSSEPFWDRNAELLITALTLHLRATEPAAPFARLANLLTGSTFEQLDEMLSASPSQEARRTAAAFMKHLKLNERTVGGVLTDIASRFFRVQNPKWRAVTAHNDIDFGAMIDTPTALYLSVPASASERLQPLTACFLMQMFTEFVARAERELSGKLPRGITCYLDEFANAGRIPHMEQRVTMLRSTRVSLIMAIQNYAQLDALYGKEHKDTIVSNATTHIVLPGAGQVEAEFYSRRIGDTTVIGQSMNNSAPGAAWTRKGSWSQGQQEAGRKLMFPEEIRTMRKGQMLLLSDTAAPIKFWNVPYYKRRQLAKRVNKPFAVKTCPLPMLPDEGDIAHDTTKQEEAPMIPAALDQSGPYQELFEQEGTVENSLFQE